MLTTDKVIIAMRNDRNLNFIVNKYLEQITSKTKISYRDFLEYAGLTKSKVPNENITFNNSTINHDEITEELQDQYWENNLEIEDLFVIE